MATITKFVSGNAFNLSKNIPTPKMQAGECLVIENVLDFSANGPGSVANGDVVQALKIPAGGLVTKVGTYCITAEGGACTATVGDTAGANSWDASIDLNSAGAKTYSVEGTDAYANGKLYTTASTIDLTMGAAASAAKIVVYAEVHFLGSPMS